VFTLALLVLVPGDIDILDSKDFPKEAQVKAVTATVRVANAAKGFEGSGALVHKGGPFLYVLTAAHVITGAKKVEVATFSAESHPRPAKVYREAEVLAQSAEADLAVLRIATRDDPPGLLRICPPGSVPEAKGLAALAVGCAAGGAPSCTLETITDRRKVRRPGAEAAVVCWEAERAPAKGRSGGPLIDRKGRLIGVASGIGDAKGYYAHTEEVHAFLKKNALEWLYEDKSDK
jgi:S1-C subfamily serine protease